MVIREYFKNKRFDAIGIESDPRSINFGRNRGLNIIDGYLDISGARPDILEIISNADIVSMMHVLEHMEHPVKIVNFLARNMKKGAFLVIECPRHPSLASFANMVAPQFTYRHIIPPVHLMIPSEKAIEMIVKNEFEMIATWGFGQGYTDILTSAMMISNVEEISLYQQLMNIGNGVQKAIDQCGYSDDMIYVMRKL